MRHYKCLCVQSYEVGKYKILPIRDEDKYAIMQWRNDQIEILRQKEPLTKASQDRYFKDVVASLFDADKPNQVLFSFLEGDLLIGYGGLVHIDWPNRNAEVSFITETSRSRDEKLFVQDWQSYLTCLKGLIDQNNLLSKIFTYAFDRRPLLYEALKRSYFMQEARLTAHVIINGQYCDVLIHSYFFDRLTFRPAMPSDSMQYFIWANDPVVRRNSINNSEIILENHQKWFSEKLASRNTVMLVAAMQDGSLLGQIRFDHDSEGSYEIDYSIDRNFRGKRMGSLLLSAGTEEFCRLVPKAKKVSGKVKPENYASARAFDRAGFIRSQTTRSDNMIVFHRDNTMA